MKTKNAILRYFNGTSLSILLSLSLAHFFNDLLQSVVSASYPVIKESLHLNFSQIGLIALTYQICASVMQPVFGVFCDKYPNPWYLVIGTISTMAGMLLLAAAGSIIPLMIAVIFVGLGSSVLHPEAAHLTHIASKGKHGLAQSIFQVGGNLGGSIGPLMAAVIIAPYGQSYFIVFAGIALISIVTKQPIVKWYKERISAMRSHKISEPTVHRTSMGKKQIYYSLFILLALIFSKHVYSASLSNFYTFYLIHKFDVSTQHSQLFLFVYFFATALGTLLGGPIGDRFGRKYVIWISILGIAPFSLLMPYVNLTWTCVLSVLIGLMLSSAFPAILVYAQELLPAKVSLISGLFFGLAFGIAGIAAAILGNVADTHGIEYVYKICAYMPLLGFIGLFLPNVKTKPK